MIAASTILSLAKPQYCSPRKFLMISFRFVNDPDRDDMPSAWNPFDLFSFWSTSSRWESLRREKETRLDGWSFQFLTFSNHSFSETSLTVLLLRASARSSGVRSDRVGGKTVKDIS